MWEQNCCTRTDGQTDMTKLIVALRNFAKSTYKGKHTSLEATNMLSVEVGGRKIIQLRVDVQSLLSRAKLQYKDS